MFRAVIPAGTDAPGFELPGLIDGEHRRVALEEFLGEDVVILAFYPADFNPACEFDSDLDELDLFTMQKDVEVLAVGPDTLYSHAAFADEYDLQIPLLSDTSHEVAETYDVAFEDDVGQRLIERAVFVIDHDGVIQYAWSTRDMEELPRSDEIKDAIADTGGDDTAFARYRVGHAHYTEGRRAFTSAMNSYRDSEWMVAQSDFQRAREEFEEAADHFDSSVRFVDDETFEVFYERAQEKATALWQAADWLSKSASEYSSGAGAEGQRLRDDAEKPLETARDLGEPVDPDEWPPEEDEDDGRESILPQDEESESSLRVDIDDEVAANDADSDGSGSVLGRESDDGGSDLATAAANDDHDSSAGEDEIDESELEEIEAELTASQPENPEGEELEETPTSMVDAPPDQTDEPVDSGNEGANDGEIDDADLQELEAEMEASQSAAEAASQAELDDEEPDDDDDEGVAEQGADPLEPDADVDEGVDGELAGDQRADAASDVDDAPADPHADLANGGSSGGTSRSLEPSGEARADGSDQQPLDDDAEFTDDGSETDEDEIVLEDEPQGASDEDLADIPTAEDLATEDDGDDE